MSPARRLLVYMWRHRRSFALGFLCVLGSTSISLTAPWVLKLAIDDLMAAVTVEKVRTYAAAIVALAVFGGTFRFLVRRIIVGASRDFEYDLRNDFFAHLQRLDLAYFQRSRTGDLMSRATNDLNAVRMMIGPAVMYTATTGLTFVVAIMMMLSIDARLAALALIPLPFVSFSVWYFGGAIHRRFEQIQEQLSEISAVTQESLAGVRVVRVYQQEPFEIERFRAANEEYVRRNRTLVRLQGVYYPSMGLLMGIGALLVLWLGGRAVVSGRITVGELVAFDAYLAMLAWPMIAFGWVTNLLQRGMASWKRMLEVLDVVPAIQDDPWDDAWAASGRTSITGDIEFRDVTLSFGARTVLDNVSFTIPAGTTTAIVGPTGSGKSTLLALLPRLLDAPHGSVLIDGVDVRRIPLATLRGAIGFVPQDPLLFSATIGENVALGLTAADVPGGSEDPSLRSLTHAGHVEAGLQSRLERITWAARIAQLDKDVADFPNGFDTMVGERGITLSGGQKQRTALARALAIDPRILVLDDALSAVDTATEEEILRGLGSVMRGRTSILVSHRVSTVRGADQILVLDSGRIVERGTHQELVRQGGFYAELYRKQLLEEELAAS